MRYVFVIRTGFFIEGFGVFCMSWLPHNFKEPISCLNRNWVKEVTMFTPEVFNFPVDSLVVASCRYSLFGGYWKSFGMQGELCNFLAERIDKYAKESLRQKFIDYLQDLEYDVKITKSGRIYFTDPYESGGEGSRKFVSPADFDGFLGVSGSRSGEYIRTREDFTTFLIRKGTLVGVGNKWEDKSSVRVFALPKDSPDACDKVFGKNEIVHRFIQYLRDKRKDSTYLV